jgi:hypothetical protein
MKLRVRLVRAITEVAARHGGVYPDTFAVKACRYIQLHDEMDEELADRGEIGPLMAPIGRPNILVMGIPVVVSK